MTLSFRIPFTDKYRKEVGNYWSCLQLGIQLRWAGRIFAHRFYKSELEHAEKRKINLTNIQKLKIYLIKIKDEWFALGQRPYITVYIIPSFMNWSGNKITYFHLGY